MFRYLRSLALLLLAGAALLHADTIIVTGTITQPQDSTEPAANNAALNNIAGGDLFLITLNFNGAISAPGTYNTPTGASLVFTDSHAGASESSYLSESLTIAQSGGFDQFSLLGCLTTGTACNQGNQL